MSWYTLASARSASMGLRSRSLTRPTIFRWDLTQREAMERLRYATLNLARGSGEMQLSERGRRLIQNFEGLRLTSYDDGAGVWTVGYGHTPSEPGVTITQEQADDYFIQDIARFERGVDNAVTVPLEQGQFDALVSFAYNVGLGAFRNSTLLRKLNDGDYEGAAEQFGRWYKAGGKIMQGLVKRRWTRSRRWSGSRRPG